MKIIYIIKGIEKAVGATTFCVRVAEELASLGHEGAILIRQTNPGRDDNARVLLENS